MSSVAYWFTISNNYYYFQYADVVEKIKTSIQNKICSNTQPHKAELLQLNRTQIPSLGIFVSKKVRNQKT